MEETVAEKWKKADVFSLIECYQARPEKLYNISLKEYKDRALKNTIIASIAAKRRVNC
jgi:hypothetical protein